MVKSDSNKWLITLTMIPLYSATCRGKLSSLTTPKYLYFLRSLYDGTERQRDRKTERNKETEKQRDRETERQRDRETERQRDRETERQRNREIEK
jgi:hypothetical protein